MGIFENYTNLYAVKKSIQIGAIPTERTKKTLATMGIVEKDRQRVENISKFCQVFDRFHKERAGKILEETSFKTLPAYESAYDAYHKALVEKAEDADAIRDELVNRTDEVLKEISDAFLKNDSITELFTGDFLNKEMPALLTDKKEKKLAEELSKSAGGFIRYHQARSLLYSVKHGSIAFRLINDNYPFFYKNCEIIEKFRAVSGRTEEFLEGMRKLDWFRDSYLDEISDRDNYGSCFTQAAIDRYNVMLNGFTMPDRVKIKGLNEYINEYNHTLSAAEKREKGLRLLDPLYKLPLFNDNSFSVIPEKFETDGELLDTVDRIFNDTIYTKALGEAIDEACRLFDKDLGEYDASGIYIAPRQLTAFSLMAFDKWNAIEKLFNLDYDNKNYKKLVLDNPKANEDKYEKDRRNVLNRNIFSLEDIRKLALLDEEESGDAVEALCRNVREKKAEVLAAYNEYTEARKERKEKEEREEEVVSVRRDVRLRSAIKGLCDSIKEFERSLNFILSGRSLTETGLAGDADFINAFNELHDIIREYDAAYNKIRNFISRTKTKSDSVELLFGNSSFLGGWSDMSVKGGTFIKDGDKIFFVAASHGATKLLDDEYLTYEDGEETVEVMDYYLLADAAKSIGRIFIYNGMKNKDGGPAKYKYNPDAVPAKEYGLTEELFNAYAKGMHKSNYKENGFTDEDNRKTLDALTEYLGKAMPKYFTKLDFQLEKHYDTYRDICDDLKKKASFALSFKKVSKDYIQKLENNGDICLFRLWCKDFSEHSSGREGNYTVILKNLFNTDKDAVSTIRLSGNAALRFEKASLKKEDLVVHKAGTWVENKNPNSENRKRKLEYDIIKDRRFHHDRFRLMLPYALNYTEGDFCPVNEKVREDIKAGKFKYITSVKGGMDNLLWVCVTDLKGNIVEQFPINTIGNTDWREKISIRQQEMKEGNKNWTPGTDIRTLKEGYLSLAIKLVYDTIMKYESLVVLEDNAPNFKGNKFGIDTRLYEVFTEALRQKLRYAFSRTEGERDYGGVLKGFQLVNPEKPKGMQDGIIFLINPAYTSNIDPATGFISYIRPRYENITRTKNMIEKIDGFAVKNGMFCMDIDFSRFGDVLKGTRSEWTVWANGSRIIWKRDEDLAKGGKFVEISINEAFLDFFKKNRIDIKGDIKAQLLSNNSKAFYSEFCELFGALLKLSNGKNDDNFIISPVKNKKGQFFNSKTSDTVTCSDSNSAYNLCRKMAICVRNISNDVKKPVPKSEEFIKEIQG